MQYIDVSHRTLPAVTRPRTYFRSMIVLHTSGGYNSLGWLMGGSVKSGKPVSSDFLVNRRGDIYQITRPYWYAYHTGAAYFRGRQEPDKTLNQQAVGVEIECHEGHGQVITNLQYISTAALVARLMGYHAITVEDVTTHAVIALPPGRKVDPQYLDWHNFTREWESPSVEVGQLLFPAVLP